MSQLKCLGINEIDYATRETYEGICGEHLGAKALTAKILIAGFYWPTMKEDVIRKVRKSDNCQRHASITNDLVSKLQSVLEPILFATWELDILGPFPQATGDRNFS